jgi:class 3 adenylate cyclase
VLLRIGVNLGDVLVEGSDLYGDGVNVAARLDVQSAYWSLAVGTEALEPAAGTRRA